MTDDQIKEKVKNALDKLYSHDFSLISRKCSERSIVFRFGIYLTQEFNDTVYDVDCEYNKNGDNPKSLSDITFNFPDIIIHERESNNKNLLVIEAKTQNAMRKDQFENDKRKLMGFTSDAGYLYQLGLHLYVTSTVCRLAWYKNGQKIEYVKYSVLNKYLCAENNQENNTICKFDKLYENN